MLEALDADAVRLWSRTAVDLLAEHSAEIDALNVFPVADSDTGSNTLTTLRGGDDALREPAGLAARGSAGVLAALAAGAARAALGNSGFLLSQILRGLAEAAASAATATGHDTSCDATTVASGLAAGARLARAAVVTPVEGTILTVAEAAAGAAQDDVADLAAAVGAALRAADAALQRTPTQLPELAQAGVVDAGGRALVVVLAALARVVTGVDAPLSPVRVPLRTGAGGSDGVLGPSHGETRAFEVQYDLTADDAGTVDALRVTLAALGDSVAVVPTGESTWKVHVHVDDVGAAIEAGVEAGRPHGISVVRFGDEQADAPTGAGDVAVLAVAPGAGLAHLFEREGVNVVEGGPDDLPEVADVTAAVAQTRARAVVLLPNAARVTGVAEAAADHARRRGTRVSVVPTRSPVQGLAAIAVHDPTRRLDDDVVAMAEAAAATRHAEITVARSAAITAAGICEPGDVLGLIDGDVVYVGRGLLAVAFGVVDRLLGVGAEIMTVLVGRDAPPRSGEQLEAHVRERAPFTDVHVYAGGQADHPLIIGVE